MRLYVSGPMTGIPDHNAPLFREAAEVLRAAGHEVVNPIELDDSSDEHVQVEGDGWTVDNEQYEQLVDRDLDRLAHVDGVVFLPGWATSGGAGREGDHALILGKRLYLWNRGGVVPLIAMPAWLFRKYRTTTRRTK